MSGTRSQTTAGKVEQLEQVLHEKKYEVLEIPMLCGLGAEECSAFLKRYDELAQQRKADNFSVPKLVECVDADLKEVLVRRNTGYLANDTKLREFLTSKTLLSEPDKIIGALRDLVMDESIQDVAQRLALYEMQYFKIHKRTTGFSLDEKESLRYYVAGLRPKAVSRKVAAYLKVTANTSFEALSAYTERELEQYTRWKHAEDASDDVDGEDKPRKKATRVQRADQSVRKQTACRGCGFIPWSSEHMKTCDRHLFKLEDARHSNKTQEVKDEKKSEAPRPKPHYKRKENLNIEVSAGATSLTAHVTPNLIPVECLADTGSMLSFMSSKLYDMLCKQCPEHLTKSLAKTTVRFANNAMEKVGAVRCELTIALPRGLAREVALEWTLYIMPDEQRERIILGTDIFESLGMVQNETLVLPWSRASEPDDSSAEDEGLADDSEVNVVENSHVTEDEARSRQLDETRKITVAPSDAAEAIRDVCEEYCDVFDTVLPKEGVKFRQDFRIELTEDRVIREPVPELQEPKLSQALAELEAQEAAGILEPSTSNWRQRVIVLKKHDGSGVRIVQDSTPINKITKPHYYPMKDIKSLIKRASGRSFHGKMDCRKGFHQWRVDPACRDMTTFEVRGVKADGTRVRKVLRYRGVPMGYTNVPMQFQEEMDILFDELISEGWAEVYIDDIYISASTAEEFVSALRRALDICRRSNLRLNASKCILGVAEIEVVGHVLSADGHRMSAGRVEAISKLVQHPPKNLHQLRQLMGTLIYHHDFIPHYHVRVKPMTMLLKNGTKFVWEESQQAALADIVEIIATGTVLCYGDEPGRAILRTDASILGVGGVLAIRQEVDGHTVDRPVCYMSKSFTPAQAKWSTYQQELFAIVYCMTYPQVSKLLMLRPFTVETDHRNLMFLEQAGEKSAMIERWRVKMLPYDFKIRHISGADNKVADALSRLWHDHADTRDMLMVETDIQGTVNETELVDKIRQAQAEFGLAEYRDTLETDHRGLQVLKVTGVIPIPREARSLIEEILRLHHGSPIIGHPGIRRTQDAINVTGITWSGITQDVENHIRRCGVCQKARLRRYVSQRAHSTSTSQPFYCVAIDTLGPFKEDSEGFAYLFVLVDIFTRFTELVASRTCDAKSAGYALYSGVFCRHGLPMKIKSDNGPEYHNGVISELLKAVNVTHHDILPYTPQSNGHVERENREILRHLRCLVCDFDAQKEWREFIPLVQFMLNATVHSATGVSPYAMLYGDHVLPRKFTPSSILERNKQTNEDDDNTPSIRTGRQYVEQLSERIKTLQDEARVQQEAVDFRRSERLQKKLEKMGNAARKVPQVGDFVLLRPITGRKGKIEPNYEGPFKVIGHDSDSVYLLQSLVNPEQQIKAHYERVLYCVLQGDGEEVEQEAIRLAKKDSGEEEVEAVLDHTGFTKRDIKFKILWKGYDESHATWEPWSNVADAHAVNAHVQHYITAHPELQHLLSH